MPLLGPILQYLGEPWQYVKIPLGLYMPGTYITVPISALAMCGTYSVSIPVHWPGVVFTLQSILESKPCVGSALWSVQRAFGICCLPRSSY